MSWLTTLLERLANGILLAGGIGLLLAMVLATADIVGTQFLGWPVPGALEGVSTTMVFIVFGALAYVQRRRGHIRVELLYSRAGPRGKAAMDTAADLTALAFFGLVLWQAIPQATASWSIREAADGLIRFPIYPAKLSIVLGVGLLVVQLVLDLCMDLRGFVGGRPARTPEAPQAIATAPDRPTP